MSSKFRIVCSFATQRFHLSRWSLSFCLRYKRIIPREMVLCTYSRRGPLRAWPAGVAWLCHIPHDTLFSRQRVTKPQMVHQSQEMAEADREADESSSQSWLEKEGGPPDLRNALPPTCRSYLVSAEARTDRNRRPLPWTRKVHAADIDNDVIFDSDVGSP